MSTVPATGHEPASDPGPLRVNGHHNGNGTGNGQPARSGLGASRTHAAATQVSTNGKGAFLAVCGHANIDIHLQVKDLPRPEQSSPVLHRRSAWGGTGANIAHQAAGLGVPSRLWALVGEDFPADWRAALHRAGVDLDFLTSVPGRSTPACIVLTDLMDRQSYCMDEGAMSEMGAYPPPDAFTDGMAAEGWLHLATGDPLVYAITANAARQRGLKVALDPGQEMRWRYDAQTFEGLLDLSDALFVNEEELRVAGDFLGYGAAEQFLDHVQTVVVTRAGKGASLYRRKQKPLHLPAFPARVVDPTGGGDALRAGWYAALHAGRPMEVALRWGLAAAAIAIGHIGGQEHILQRSEVDALLATSSAA